MRYKLRRSAIQKLQTKCTNLTLAVVIAFTGLSGSAPLFLASTATAAGSQTADHVVINEVMTNPSVHSKAHQWVELYNPTDDSVNISNYRIYSRSGSSSQFKYYGHVFGSSSWDVTTNIPSHTFAVYPTDGNGMSYSNSTVYLFSDTAHESKPKQNQVDSLSYGSTGKGTSTGLKVDGVHNSPSDIITFANPTKGKSNNPTSSQQAASLSNMYFAIDKTGFNVGFHAHNFQHVSNVAVTLKNANGSIVTNTGQQDLFDLINGKTDKAISSPFGVPAAKSTDNFWKYGNHTWTKNDNPTKAVITITDNSGKTSHTIKGYSHNTYADSPTKVQFQDLLPTAAPAITNANAALWNKTYKGITTDASFKDLSNHVAAYKVTVHRKGSDDVTVKATDKTIGLLNNGQKTITTPTFIQDGSDTAKKESKFWTQDASAVWNKNTVPETATATVKLKNGTELHQQANIKSNGINYESLLPPAKPKDTKRPTGTITSPSGKYINTRRNFTVKGTYKEHGNSGINPHRFRIYLSVGDQYESGKFFNDGYAKVNKKNHTWSYTVPAKTLKKHLSNGDKLNVLAIPFDNAGNGGRNRNIQRYYTVDNSRPTATITKPSGDAINTHSKFTVSGNYTEHGGSGLNRIRVYVSHGDRYESGKFFNDGYAKFKRNHKNGGTWHYTLTAKQLRAAGLKTGDQINVLVIPFDNAGNGGNNRTVQKFFTIDNAKPTAKITNPSGSYVNSHSNLNLKGAYQEHGKAGISRLRVYVSKGDRYHSQQFFYSGKAKLNKSNQTWQFKVPAKVLKNHLANGDDVNVLVVPFDKANNGGNNRNVQKHFTVDNQKPTATIEKPSGNDINTHSKFTVSGKFQEHGGSGLNRIRIYVSHGDHYQYQQFFNDGYAKINRNKKHGGSWSYTLTAKQLRAAGLKTGDQINVLVVPIDNANNGGNNRHVQKAFTIDNAGPDVKIVDPSGYVNTVNYNGRLDIRGHATDQNFDHYSCYVTTDHDIAINGQKYAAGDRVGTQNDQCANSTNEVQVRYPGTVLEMPGYLGYVDMDNAPDGNYTAHLVAYDKVGNVSRTTSSFHLDNSGPAINNIQPSDTTVGGNVKVSATITDQSGISGASYNLNRLDGNGKLHTVKSGLLTTSGNNVYASTSINTTKLEDGSYQWSITAGDNSHNSTSKTASFKIDNHGPAITINSPTDKYISNLGKLTFTGTAKDMSGLEADKVNLCIDDLTDQVSNVYCDNYVKVDSKGNWRTTIKRGKLANLNGHKILVHVSGKDGQGHTTDAKQKYILDSSRPQVSFVTPSRFNDKQYNQYFQQLDKIEVKPSDPVSDVASTSVHVYNADGSQSNAFCSHTTTCDTSKLPNGDYYVKIGVIDNAGNHQTVTKTFTIDSTAPAAPTANPPAGTYDSAQTVTLADSDASASIYYTTDGSTPYASSTKYTDPITVSQDEAIKAVAIDEAGNVSDVLTAAYTIDTGSSDGGGSTSGGDQGGGSQGEHHSYVRVIKNINNLTLGTFNRQFAFAGAGGSASNSSVTTNRVAAINTVAFASNPGTLSSASSSTTGHVLGASTDKPSSSNGHVQGNKTVTVKDAANTTSGNSMGLAWYWWLLMAAAVAAIIAVVYRKAATDNKSA
jgi:hypothetical protein